MARQVHKLTAVEVKKATTAGMYGDGAGLYLQVSSTGSKSWLFRYMRGGRAREMGLGSCLDVSLADARQSAADCRKHLQGGIDPIEARRAKLAAALALAAKSLSFEQCAAAYIKAHETAWRNAKHATQWTNTLRDYANPKFGKVSVADIDTGLVLSALEPLWGTKPETASRLRGRIENILDWAAARGHRKGDNPARWRGHLSQLLPKHSKIAKVAHHPALPYSDAPAFITLLRTNAGTAARALEFTVLTAARTGEVLGAQWGEVDLDGRVWVIPAARMKAQREHRVPLSTAAVRLLQEAREGRESAFLFPGLSPKKSMSNMAMLKVLERMKRDDLTVHGFRSTFRDWAAETTDFSPEVVEMALAHTIANKAEAAYRRGDLLAKRAALMEAWATYLSTQTTSQSNVVDIRRDVQEVAA